MSKDYSIFWAKTQKCFGKTESVLAKHFLLCQNTFCFYLLGLFISIGEKLFQGYILQTFLVIGDYKKIWNRIKIFFWCALSIAALSPPIQLPLKKTVHGQCWPRGSSLPYNTHTKHNKHPLRWWLHNEPWRRPLYHGRHSAPPAAPMRTKLANRLCNNAT